MERSRFRVEPLAVLVTIAFAVVGQDILRTIHLASLGPTLYLVPLCGFYSGRFSGRKPTGDTRDRRYSATGRRAIWAGGATGFSQVALGLAGLGASGLALELRDRAGIGNDQSRTRTGTSARLAYQGRESNSDA